jgi:hypothetical protein
VILGMSVSAFTSVHVILSLIGILSGLVAVFGMLGGKRPGAWTVLFLATTVLTSVTGFFFPFTRLGPAHIVGILSLAVLAVALVALYVFRVAVFWRWIYVASALLALYFNVFIGVVQAFQKLAFLQPLAPTQTELPFVVAQVLVIAIFLALGFQAVKRFHPDMAMPA